MQHIIPPAIRVFISSTFSDMVNERKYFNTVLEPELFRLCALRGVSFFAVDLRWGITGEQAENGEVIPICLREIDNCRPFFIGIIGNRYGSTLSEIGFKYDGRFPWLKGRENKSATELEMLYGVLDCEEGKESADCIFMLRSDRLSAESYQGTESEEKKRSVLDLRKRISECTDIPSEDYDSLEEFGEKLKNQFVIWLDRIFPSTDSAARARHDFYNGELMRNYIELRQTEGFINRFCQFGHAPLLINGSGPCGKTSLLTHWEPENGRKILINVESDPAYTYWPAAALDILEKLQGKKVNFPEYYETDKELDSFRRFFVDKIGRFRTDTPTYIVINDIDKMHGAKAEFLCWLPAILPENLKIICSAGNRETAEIASQMDWIVQELPVFGNELAAEFLNGYLELYGKSLSPSQGQAILRSGTAKRAGYIKRIVKFLNSYAAFESLDEISDGIGNCETDTQLHEYIWNYACRNLSATEIKAAESAAYFLSSSLIEPGEEDLYAWVNRIVETNRIEWSSVSVLLDLFDIKKSDTWKIVDGSVRSFFEQMPVDRQMAEKVLGGHYLELLNDITGDKPGQNEDTKVSAPEKKSSPKTALEQLKRTVQFAKAAVHHLLRAGDFSGAAKLLDDTVLSELLMKTESDFVRSSWMKIILESDTDVEGMLLAHQDRRFIPFLFDLGFEDTATKEYEKTDGSATVSDLRHRYLRFIDRRIFDFYSKLVVLYQNGQYNTVCDMVEKVMRERSDSLNPYERFLLLFKYAETLAVINRFDKCIEVSRMAYREAIRSMSDYDVVRTVMLMGTGCLGLGRIDKAEEHFNFVLQRAAALGSTPSYLDALGKLGICRARRGDPDLSVFTLCEKIWDKLGCIKDAIDSIIEEANTLSMRGEAEKACDELMRADKYLQEHIGKLDAPVVAQAQIMFCLANIKRGMGDITEAEKYYLRVRDIAEGTPAERILPNLYHNLLTLYKEKGMRSQSARIHAEYADFLYKYGDIENTVNEIKEACANYLEAGLRAECEAFERKWEERKAKDARLGLDIGNTDRNGIKAEEPALHFSDTRAAEWEKKLLLARSGGNEGDIAAALLEGAEIFRETDPSAARKLVSEAAGIMRNIGDNESAEHIRMSNAGLFLILDEDDPERAAYFSGCSDEDLAMYDIWGKMVKCGSGSPEYARYLSELLQCEKLNGIRMFCILSEAENILKYHNRFAPGIMKMLADTGESESFINKAGTVYSDLMELQYENMKNDPMNPKIKERLEYYRDAVEALRVAGSPAVGYIAGQLTTILRMRGEYELALNYHGIASKAYLEASDGKEYLTEQINTALTYKAAGDLKKSEEILSEMLEGRVFPIDDFPFQKAAAYGHLAALIRSDTDEGGEPDPEREKLLMKCFEEEESYFRSIGEPYDICVALVNQLHYYSGKPQKYREAILSKFREILKIATDHSLKNILYYLERYKEDVLAKIL